MNGAFHPLLDVIQSVITRAAPDPRWREGDAVCIGIATPLGPQWLAASRARSRIDVVLSHEAPPSPRAMLVMLESVADRLLGGAQTSIAVDDTELVGDAGFFRITLGAALGASRPLELRSREVTRGR